jgi:Fur family ferric uptake transcriptional regulator
LRRAIIFAVPRDTPDRSQWTDHALGELKRAGHRTGGARTAVVRFLARQDCCLTAHEIFERLRSDDRAVGVASVYRTLDLLTRMELVRRLDIGASACFEPAYPGGEHHHHVVCDDCGKVASFEDEALENAIDRVAGRLKYTVGLHEVVLRGACPDCERRSRRRRVS